MHSLRLALPALLALGIGSTQAGFDPDGISYASPAGSINNGRATALALSPDGGFYASGYTITRNTTDDYTYRLLRYDAQGDVDPGFVVAEAHTGYMGVPRRGLLLQPDGAIITAYTLANPMSLEDSYTHVRRFLPNGSSDPAFSTFSFDASFGADELVALALQADGRIVAVGSRPNLGGGGRVGVLLRLATDGSIDESFSADGYVSIGAQASPNFFGVTHDDISLSCVALMPDGRVFVAGTGSAAFTYSEMLFQRFLPDGSPDPDFNSGDPIVFAPRDGNSVGQTNTVSACDVAPDGSFVIAGVSTASGVRNAWLLQFDATGGLLAAREDDTDSRGNLTDIQLLPNGGVVAAGSFYDGQDYGLFAVFEQGLAFSGLFYGRFLGADRGHGVLATAFDPLANRLISVGWGITLEEGLYSNRWLAAVDAIATDLDLTPDPFAFQRQEGVAPSSLVSDTQPITGFSGWTRLPLRVRNGTVTNNGVSLVHGGTGVDTLGFMADASDTPSLLLETSHLAADSISVETVTRLEVGGLVRSSNLALSLGAPRVATLESLTGLDQPLLRDGFESLVH